MSKKVTKATVTALAGGKTDATTNKSASKKSGSVKAKKGISGPLGIVRLRLSDGGPVQKPN